MGSKRPKPEEIVSKLRQVEVLQGQGAHPTALLAPPVTSLLGHSDLSDGIDPGHSLAGQDFNLP